MITNTNLTENSVYLLELPRQSTNPFVKWLQKQNLISHMYHIFTLNEMVYIPIIQMEIEFPSELSSIKYQILDYPSGIQNQTLRQQISEALHPLDLSDKHIPSLKKALEGKIPAEYLDLIPQSYDIIGQIAILELNRNEQTVLQPYVKIIGEAMLKKTPSITSVFEKAGDVNGIFRTRELRCIAGKDNSITLHKENNCVFELDVGKTFFTPRLVFERKRVADIQSAFTCTGVTWDVFCGVGPFIIQIAKNNPTGSFLGTDINPSAIEFARKNIIKNKIQSKISVLQQDITQIAQNTFFTPYYHQISRIIMNLPEKNLEFLEYLPNFIHPNGALLHIYQFNEKKDALVEAETKLKNALQKAKLKLVHVENKRIVKPFSPALDTTVIDAIIQYENK